MSDTKRFSRRDFFRLAGLAALPLVAGGMIPKDEEVFEMLVVGDSLVWGQGLQEPDKFYTLVGNWIQTALGVTVNLKVKAHTAATIFLHERDAGFREKANAAGFREFRPEVGLAFPTLKDQIDGAAADYRDPQKLRLVLLTGGLVDITVAGVLNPYGENEKLRKKIAKYCGEDMTAFLDHAGRVFPDALLVVAGYYPIITDATDTGRMLNAFLEAYGFPTRIKPLVNNAVGKRFFRRVRRKAIERSAIWYEDSNRHLQAAVERVNSRSGRIRALFVPSPIRPENAFETDDTLLFKIDRRGRTDDALFDERVVSCRETLSAMKKKLGYEDSVRQCEISSMGHPNVRGAAAYAAAIVERLKTAGGLSAL
ncbi:MAG: hypothetical protein JSS81_08595 [Acidobacteria bacterium]|nr:hypothetical protein [Acidobacteriota bacterium]